ncbi:unnamed protein product [Linum trigynum]|uniref:Uncharacterized protein n=1 Tax=Linum trigynum TaxID=586398 RepID=A0AAV2G0Q3_9ROSI
MQRFDSIWQLRILMMLHRPSTAVYIHVFYRSMKMEIPSINLSSTGEHASNFKLARVSFSLPAPDRKVLLGKINSNHHGHRSNHGR